MLEYIFAAFLLVTIIFVAQTNMNMWISHQLHYVEQRDYSMSSSFSDLILMSPGDPPDWGDSTEKPILFGLASYKTTEMYDLDAKKVFRLHRGSSSYISSGELRSILHLSSSYGFAIRIRPLLSLGISSPRDGFYSVAVTDRTGRSTANVNVTGYYVHESLSSDYERRSYSNVTGVSGECSLEFQPETGYVLVVCADLLGAKTMRTYPADLNMMVEGGRVIESDVPLVSWLDYTSGSFVGLTHSDKTSRIVRIEGFYFYFEFEVWE